MTYKPYKMRGPSLYRNRKSPLTQKSGPNSSEPVVEETWNEPTTTRSIIDNDQGGKTTTTNTNQKGNRKTTTTKKHVGSWAEACKGKTSGTGTDSTGKKWNCNRKKDWKPSDQEDVTNEPLEKNTTDVKSTEKKKCQCQTYKADGSKGPMVTHECGNPNPNCSKRPTTTTKKCACTDKSGKNHSYPCGEEKPVACRTKASQNNPDCPPSSQKSCGKNRRWSWKKCRCEKRDKAKPVRYKKRCYKGKNGSTECSDFQAPKGTKGFWGS